MEARAYSYSCVFESVFAPAVGPHFFKLRVRPAENSCQHVLEGRLDVVPCCSVGESEDGFGNGVQYGGLSVQHDTFRVESRGRVVCGRYAVEDESPSDIYLCPTAHTVWNDEIRSLASGDAAEIMHSVHGSMEYERFVTDNSTTALDAMRQRRGVCQDYAHLMISACRSVGLRARYANGLMLGEGETHAWVEVHDGHRWLGYDPTLDRLIDFGYVKFAHGRDVGDCPTNRGRFYQWTSERMMVYCKLEEL